MLAPGCAEPPLGRPALETHVEDWRDEIIYQVVVDRFDNGDTSNDALEGLGTDPLDLRRHQGGDWAGLRRRLGYIRELGATAIWISPIVRNVDRAGPEDGYHGYWASDFTELNPRFGDMQELRRLVRDAHALGLKVIVDVVTNHAGRVFDYDLDGDGVASADEIEPPFRAAGPYDVPLLWRVPPPRLFSGEEGVLTLGPEHFRRRGLGDVSIPLVKVLGDFPTGLRDLDTEREDVLAALIDTYVRWVVETDIDGFRIDAVPHVEQAFWPRFCTGIRERLAALGKERFLMLGEVFVSDGATIAEFTREGGIDSFMDLPFKLSLVDGVLLSGEAPATARRALVENRTLFPSAPHPQGIGVDPWRARAALLDNHDTWRIRGELDDPKVVTIGLMALFALDAIPVIYYGTEAELDGMGGGASREPLWEHGFAREGRTFDRIQALAALRRGSAALRRGSLELRYASEFGGLSDAPDAGILSWERHLEALGGAPEERILLVINAHALQSSRATIPSGFAAGTVLIDALDPGVDRFVVAAGGEITLSLGPRRGLLLMAR